MQTLDDEVNELIKAGHIARATSLIVEVYGPRLRRELQRRISCAAAAEEAWSDVLSATSLALPRFKGETSIWGYLKTAAKNAAKKWYRRRRDAPLPSTVPGPERSSWRNPSKLRMLDDLMLESLSELDATIVGLRNQGHEFAEIAVQLRLSNADQVRSRLRRAHSTLVEAHARKQTFSPSSAGRGRAR